MAHFHLIQTPNSPSIEFNFIKKTMNLSTDQKLALANRIANEYSVWVKDELRYQIENMKDLDELNWEYYPSDKDTEDITELVIDLIAVPVQ